MKEAASMAAALLFVVVVCFGNYEVLSKELRRPGPQYYPTKGQPWPKPQLVHNYEENFMIIRPPVFRFQIVRNTCNLLEDALKRYYTIMLNSSGSRLAAPVMKQVSNNRTSKSLTAFNGFLDVLKIDLMTACETYPHDNMDEAYEIKIDTPDLPGEALLTASTNWGILRGLETFSQLIHSTDDYTSLQIKSTLILDYPRFPFRSVLLDTSRHYLSKKVLYENLDLMAMNKYNVFHWHVVDDQAFPYQSKLFPNISDKGAYHPYTHVYTQQDVADVIEYARVRGIRVVSEFDTPGHTAAWGPGVPGLLTECYTDGVPDGTYGPIDPTRPENYEFLRRFFQEVVTVFPEKYLHLGGDEVDYKCWASSPRIAEFMASKNYTKYSQLEEYYMQKLVNIINEFPQKNSYLVWQEVVDNGVRLDNATIVHVWKHNEDYYAELSHVTSLGYRSLLSACWYLNYISYGIDWPKYYNCDPHNFNGTDAQKLLVFGGGPAMWGEFVDSTNIVQRLWPRAALPAERLWSNQNVKDTGSAARRLEEHRCRLLKRGYKIQPPNGPGYCLVSWD